MGLVLGVGVMFASATGSQPGSELDPLVTKSYVDQQIAALTAGGTVVSGGTTADGTAVAQLQTDVGELTHFIIDALLSVEELDGRMKAIEAGFEVVEVHGAKTLLLHGGAEVIVRSGKAVAVQGTYGGLANATNGTDLRQGAAVTNQHLLISSRTDGRGLKFESTGTSYLLIRGGYTMQ